MNQEQYNNLVNALREILNQQQENEINPQSLRDEFAKEDYNELNEENFNDALHELLAEIKADDAFDKLSEDRINDIYNRGIFKPSDVDVSSLPMDESKNLMDRIEKRKED